MVILLCWFGTISLMLALIPSVAILPILLYIGMLIGSQAFQETPQEPRAGDRPGARAAPGELGASRMINGALAAAGTVVATLSAAQLADLIGKMRNEGVLYHGLQVLGGGSILGGLILGAIAVFIIDRNFMKAAGFALAGAVLTFFGFMHGERIGIGETPVVAVSYLMVAVDLRGLREVRDRAGVRRRGHAETLAERRAGRRRAGPRIERRAVRRIADTMRAWPTMRSARSHAQRSLSDLRLAAHAPLEAVSGRRGHLPPVRRRRDAGRPRRSCAFIPAHACRSTSTPATNTSSCCPVRRWTKTAGRRPAR